MGENSKIEWTDLEKNPTGRTLGAYKSAAKKTGLSLEQWIQKINSGLAWCYRCKDWHSQKMFVTDNSRLRGRTSQCKSCASDSNIISRYKISREELYKLRKLHNGKCAICFSEKKLVIDHCHSTNKVRGLLCQNCNSAIGKFGEDIKVIKSAIIYLNAHSRRK